MERIKTVILCGGQGMRIREETEFKPKPMIQIGGRPILWHIMKIYAHYGFKEFVLCLGYKGDVIKHYFLDYEMMNNDFTIELGRRKSIQVHNHHPEEGWRVTLAETGLNAQTGARIKRIERYIDSDIFMLTYGDGVSDVNIGELVEFHKAHGRTGTVTGVRPSSRFGELVAEGGQVIEFNEKPQTTRGLISGGFFVFNREVFKYVSDADECNFERGPLEQMARDGELMVYPHQGYWQCLDTIRDLKILNEEWESGSAPWKVWGA